MSCLKQTLTPTPTMVPVISIGTKSQEEIDGVKEASAAEAAAIAVMVAETNQWLNICSKKKMNDCLISKLTITETGH